MRRNCPAILIAMGLCVSAIVVIAAGYSRFSQAYDEPAHVACGMEWLDKGTYAFEPLHPPLARVAVALGPFLTGSRSSDEQIARDPRGESFDIFAMGNAILYKDSHYWRTLALARLGEIPFFALGVLVVFFWARRLAGDFVAVLAVFCFVTLPSIIAFAGVAYTDLPVAVLTAASFFAFSEWLENPEPRQTLLLAPATGLAILSKFTALLFLPAGFLAIVLSRVLLEREEWRPSATLRKYLITTSMAALLSAVLIWSGYRFSLQRLDEMYANPRQDLAQLTSVPGPFRALGQHIIAWNPLVPAPAFFKGITADLRMNARALPSYLFGRIRRGGWWYFFLVLLAVKTPIPFLILTMVGFSRGLWSAWRSCNCRILAPGACAIAMILVTMPARVNLGTRHILAVYPLLSILAGYGGVWLYEQGRGRRRSLILGILIGLLLWQGLSLAQRGGDHLAYFNAFAGKHPERVALWGCDLDCGQDLGRLSRTLRERHVQHVSLSVWTSADLTRSDLPQFEALLPSNYPTGWVAASVKQIVTGNAFPAGGDPLAFAWLERYKPVAFIGNTILLYYIAPPTPPANQPPSQRPRTSHGRAAARQRV